MIFSVGHSTHSIQEFCNAARGMDLIIDVRSHPTSRWEQFRQEQMEKWLPETGAAYLWMPALGGWTKRHYEEYHEAMAAHGVDLAAYSRGVFPKQRIGTDRIAESKEKPSWTNQGLYDYSWYTSTPEFLAGAERLISEWGSSADVQVAIMCCEALWWKCHRSMIADYLYSRDVFCGHLPPKPPKRPTTRRFKPHSEAIGNRLQRYDPIILEAWQAHASRI